MLLRHGQHRRPAVSVGRAGLWAADPSRESDWQSTEGVEQQVSFELVTGDIGQDGAEQRYLSRLTLRLDAACASTVEVALSYDAAHGRQWQA